MDNNKAFAAYAGIFTALTALAIYAAFVISGMPTEWIPGPAVAIGDLALGCITRGYCLGFFTYETGHWSFAGPEA